MGFHKIVLKMAKANYKKYIFYVICNTAVVMIFFMFSTIFFNEEFQKVKKEEAIDDILAVPAVALLFFTLFFIQYAHNIFIKKRKKEFALLMTIGMEKRDIVKLLQIENFIIIVFSIVVGLLFGVAFSRLFFLMLMKGIEFDKIHYQLNEVMFIVTIGLFLLIQLFVIGKSLYQILYRNLIENLKSDRESQHLTFQNTAFGVVGLGILIFSIAGLYFSSNITEDYLYLWAILTFFGLYISLSQFMNLFIQLAKKNVNFYYSKIMFFSNLHYKFQKLFPIMMLVSIMFMITIWYTTIIILTFKELKKEFLERNPFDLAYIQTDTKNNIPFDEVKMILETDENKISKHFTFPVHEYFEYDNLHNWNNNYYILPLDAFNRLATKRYTLENNEFIYFYNETQEVAGKDLEAIDELTLPAIDKQEIRMKRKHTVIDQKINYVGGIYECIVVNNQQFEFLKEKIEGFSFNVHLINFDNWKMSENVIEQLSNTFLAYNQKTPKLDDKLTSNDEEYFNIESKTIYIKRLKNFYGLQLFVTIFLSVLFFIGAFMLLYLNLFADIDKEKKMYKKLFNIGISKKELKKMITSEMRMLFYLPTFIGAMLAFFYLVSLAKEDGGIVNNPDILLYFFITASLYFFIQIIFYFFSKIKIVHELTKTNPL